MGRTVLAVFLTTVISYSASFGVYGAFHAFAGLKAPDDVSPARLLLSFLIVKVGLAIGFVLIFYSARHALNGQWLLYAATWWLMFAIVEVGQAIGPNYSWKEALAGVISETIYFPASAFVTNWLLGVK